jgi:rhodanese-related sulfurtransferase
VSADPSRGVENVPVHAVWLRLAEVSGAVLIDVRTRAEWTYVGIPDLSPIGKSVLLVEWQGYPDNKPHQGFVQELESQLEKVGATKETELYFICRSGARSLAAAGAMARAGFERCFNVAEGFEGPLDEHRHRGALNGWKAEGLPWLQG